MSQIFITKNSHWCWWPPPHWQTSHIIPAQISIICLLFYFVQIWNNWVNNSVEFFVWQLASVWCPPAGPLCPVQSDGTIKRSSRIFRFHPAGLFCCSPWLAAPPPPQWEFISIELWHFLLSLSQISIFSSNLLFKCCRRKFQKTIAHK